MDQEREQETLNKGKVGVINIPPLFCCCYCYLVSIFNLSFGSNNQIFGIYPKIIAS